MPVVRKYILRSGYVESYHSVRENVNERKKIAKLKTMVVSFRKDMASCYQ